MPGPRRLALAALQLASVWAVAQGAPWVFVLAVPALLAARVQLELPPRLLRVLEQAARLAFLGMVGFGVMWVVSPQLPDALAPRVGAIAGLVFVLLSAALGFTLERVAPERGVVPACLGAFLSAALDPQAALTGPLLLGFSAMLVFLAAGVPGRASRWLAFSVLVASSLAYGLVELLPWAQPQVEAAVAGAISSSAGFTGFGPGGSLGDVSALALSRRPALRVYAPRALKLRAQVLTRFDGRSWTLDPPALQAVQQLVDAPTGGPVWVARPGFAPPGPLSGALFTVLPAQGGALLFVPARTAWARASSGTLHWLGAGVLRAGVPSAAYEALVPDGARALDDGACDACLSLPARVDPRFVALARELGAGQPPPEERVARTLAHLDRTCRYTLEPGTFRSADPLAEFLFEKRAGYCEYFASAAAVLLRLQGLETRYVKGFNLTEEQRLGDHYLVLESAAHAWIDARLPGRGWVEQDPTPAADYELVHAGDAPGAWARAWERLASALGRLRAWFALQSLGDSALWSRLALVVVAVVGLVFAVRRLRLRRPAASSERPGLSPELARLVRLLDAHCERTGHARPPSRGLLEHLRGLPADSTSDEWRASGVAVAERVYAAAYGGATLTSDELRMLGAQLEHR